MDHAPDVPFAPPPAPPPIADYLSALNPSQRQAVETVEGPVLVLAGAGTGKTRVLTTRLAHVLAIGRARPWQVLAVTFTNKAAREMRERVAAVLGCSVEGWWVGTFHAVAARMLRANAEWLGFTPSFTILDADDQLRLIKQVLEARAIDGKRTPPRLVLSVIQRWKDKGLTPERVARMDAADTLEGVALAVYHDYQERLTALNATDFGDLLLLCLRLFDEHVDVLERYQRQFRYLLVDEYQDTNVAQYLWLQSLAKRHRNICCVGDDDQSIYSWRGAEIGNILKFEQDFPGARVIRLECNYRSTPHILAAASGLIAHNRGRLGKTLWTEHREGEKIRVRAVWDGEEEARAVCEEVDRLRRDGHALKTMAVLVRAGFQTREFEERLVTVGLPYRIVGGTRFYERQEIRDAIAYFRVVAQPDDDLAFERIINVPKRGLGTVSLRGLHAVARAQRCSLFRAAGQLTTTDDLKPPARRALAQLLGDFERWRRLLATTAHAEVARIILDESGYTRLWQADRGPEAEGRLENLKELIAALAEFDTLTGFLEHVSLVMDNDEAAGDDKLSLMTLHAAKGLEFDTVFLPGWEEGTFPNQRALEESGASALEEERRLAYVGLTRARQRAFVSYAANRMIYGFWQAVMPSRFVTELPPETVEETMAPSLRAHAFHNFAGGPAWSERCGAGATDFYQPPPPQRRRQPLLIEGEARPVIAAAHHHFSEGQRVFHQKFGYGLVQRIDGDRLEIAFEKAGTKTVIHSFVEAA